MFFHPNKQTTQKLPTATNFSIKKPRTQRETMASRIHPSWPVAARYVNRAAKARFPTTRLVVPCRPPPPKKGPLPAPATPRRRLPAILQAKAPPFPKNSPWTNSFPVGKVSFENLGDIFLVLGSRRAYEQQHSGEGVRRVDWSEAMGGGLRTGEDSSRNLWVSYFVVVLVNSIILGFSPRFI